MDPPTPQENDDQPEALDANASEAKPSSIDEFLAAAIEHDFIKPVEISRIQSYVTSNNVSPSDAALNLAVLATSEVEAIKLLGEPKKLLPGYELKRLIGYGAGGMVFEAQQVALGRRVALKTISPGVQISNSVSRMQREATSIARLQHPNIVSVYDSTFANGRFCIAMELVNGGSLADRIREQGTLSEIATWHIARQVASALQQANERGIIHRDIKPGNILLCEPPAGINLPEGVPFAKVADFGLALESENGDTQLTETGTGLGTPAYVAPEQIDDSHVDMRADIYALGATVFHMLTGSEPYAYTSPIKIITQKSVGDDSWRDELTAKISAGSRQLFLDLTESNADHRVSSYEELIDRIDEVLLFASTSTDDDSSQPENKSETIVLDATPTKSFETESSPAATRTFSKIERKRPRSFPYKWLFVLLGMALALPLGFGVLQWLGKDNAPASGPSIAVADWRPDGFPTPLFNGRSAPSFDKTGLWLPTAAADGSRVLTGQARSKLYLPISIDKEDLDECSRLRFAVNLKPKDKFSLAISNDGADTPFLQLVHNEAVLLPRQETAPIIPLAAPDNEQEVAFQRIELFRKGSTLAIFVNGKYFYDQPCDAGITAIAIHCLEGQPEFADMDLARMIKR